MNGIYAWVDWFQELAKKVADGTPEQLAKRAKQVKWIDEDSKLHQLLQYGDDNIDPFSFVYTISARRGNKSQSRIVHSISEEFDLQAEFPVELDAAFYFPRGYPGNTLSHKDGAGNPELLWRLFRHALLGVEEVRGEDFDHALKIGNVAINKLTQTLFLINPKEFSPCDDSTRQYMGADLPKNPSWNDYRHGLTRLHDAFPECEPYEINLFTYSTYSKELKPSSKFFQVSTDIFYDGKDHWKDFESNSWVCAPGPAFNVPFGKEIPDSSARYPLSSPTRGDIMLVHQRNKGKGIGVVWRNEYQERLSADCKMQVIWLNKNQAAVQGLRAGGRWFSQALKSKTAFRGCAAYQQTLALLEKFCHSNGGDIKEHDQPLNQILYGPPGTGKTWKTVNLALQIVDGRLEDAHDLDAFQKRKFNQEDLSGNIAMVTFHQNFAYEDFVEGIRPVLDREQEGLRYTLHEGLFQQIAHAARERPEENFVLIIDEINRGNIARIFGELITLIEDSRRIGNPEETEVTLPYSKESFGVPSNLYLIGTMNTADRSIQLLDTALRRRFKFVEMMPEPYHQDMAKIEGLECGQMLSSMNERIAVLLDREHQIGHTYLLGVQDMVELSDRFRTQIFPLLQEYFFDDWSKIKKVLGKSPFVVDKEIRDDLVEDNSTDDEQRMYGRLADDRPEWESPDAYRKIYDTNTNTAG